MDKKQLLLELKKERFSDFIIKAFEKVKRELFVPENLKSFAYEDCPLPLTNGATISQPYTIAFMLNLLELDKLTELTNNYDKLVSDNLVGNNKKENYIEKHDRLSKREMFVHSKSQKHDINNKKLGVTSKNNKIKILEVGSGSGYVLALINEILKILKIDNFDIYGIERIGELADSSKKVLKKHKNIKIIFRDGSQGYSEKVLFDRILVSASYNKIPKNLFEQLKNNGILLTPVKNSIFQFKKINDRIYRKEFSGFVFVPVVEDM